MQFDTISYPPPKSIYSSPNSMMADDRLSLPDQRAAPVTQEDAFRIGALCELLTWNSCCFVAAATSAAERAHLCILTERLSAMFAVAETAGLARIAIAVRENLTLLDNESLMRVLYAPETYRRLGSIGAREVESAVSFIADSVEAERRLRGEAPGEAPIEPLWTALGDALLSSERVLHRDLPTEEGKIIIDTRSPRGLGTRVSEADRFVPSAAWMTVDEITVARQRLETALRGLRHVAFAAYDFVIRSVRTIRFEADQSRPEFLRSVSNKSSIGCTVLVNPHARGITPARIADSLVHEATHSYLYKVEQANRWVRDPEGTAAVRINSPWTRNPLRLDSYFQACFVWFGLAMLWRRVEPCEEFPESDITRLRNRAVSGFTSNAINQDILSHRTEVLPEVASQILRGADIIRTTAHQSPAAETIPDVQSA